MIKNTGSNASGIFLFAHGSSCVTHLIGSFVFAVASAFIACFVGVFSCIIFGHISFLHSKTNSGRIFLPLLFFAVAGVLFKHNSE